MKHAFVRATVLGAAGVLALAACSSSKSGTATKASSTSATSAAATAAATTAAAPSTKAQLEAALLQTGDLPAGWTGKAHEDDPTDDQDDAEMQQCVGGKDTTPDKSAEADSQDFSDATGDPTISSTATSYKSQSDIDDDIATLKGPKISACYSTLLSKEISSTLPAGSAAPSVNFTVTPGSAGGPSNVVATGKGTITVVADGEATTVYTNVVFITGNQIEAEVDFTSPGTEISADVVSAATAAVAGRIAKL